MFECKNELVTIPNKFFKGVITEEKVTELNALFNQRATEGRELLTHTFMVAVGESGKENAMLITFRATEKAASTVEYKCELMEVPNKFLSTALINEKQVAELDVLFNQRIAEGWEPVAQTYITSTSDTPKMFITFKKTK